MTERVKSTPTLPQAVAAAAFVCAVGLTGGLLTQPSEWSAALMRPSWHPPAWVFGTVWAAVGVTTVIGLAAGWEALTRARDRKAFLTLMTVNAFFHIAWNALFFVLRRPDLAFVDIVALWLSIAAVIAFLATSATPRAAVFLVPYLAWVNIAAVLNFEIVRLNAPF